MCIVTIVGFFALRPVRAATLAGTIIVNRARAQGLIDAQDLRLESNATADSVAEVLDASLVSLSPSPAPLADRTDIQAAPFVLRNLGNGAEAFVISTEIEGSVATLSSVAIDSDNDGRFDPAIDTITAPNGETPPLAPGASMRLLALLRVVSDGEGGLTMRARAVTGTGTPGTLFAGRGDGGSDAMTGPTSGGADAALRLLAAAPALSVVKSQRVVAANGSDRPAHGAILRYSIETRLTAGPNVSDARIVDPVPAGTRYVAGSLQLDGAALSEARDDDPGQVLNDAIEVALGDLVAPATRTVTFDVTIN